MISADAAYARTVHREPDSREHAGQVRHQHHGRGERNDLTEAAFPGLTAPKAPAPPKPLTDTPPPIPQ